MRIFKSHKASQDTSLILCIEQVGIAYSFGRRKMSFFCQIYHYDFTELPTHRPVRNFVVLKPATWL